MQRDSVQNVIIVSLGLCLVCSVIVSTAAVKLRPFQEANRKREVQKNILVASGAWDAKTNKSVEGNLTVSELFEQKQVEKRLIDFDSGEYVTEDAVSFKFDNFDPIKSARDPELGSKLGKEDIAKIRYREKYTFVYLVKDSEGGIAQYVLPIRGYGLWSTLKGFIAFDKDLKIIQGLTFYEHKETPGLGGEVDNPNWKKKWQGKTAFSDDGDIKIEVLKGAVDPDSPEAQSQVDGLSGATITTKGIDNMLKYWLGEHGYGPFMTQIKETGEK